MRAFVEDGRFIIQDLAFHRKELAKSCGFHWSSARRVWMCPANFISAYALKGSAWEHDDIDEIEDWLSRKIEMPKRKWEGLKLAPMEHQKEGAANVIGRKRFGLFFEMACGKTLTALMAARELFREGKASRVLIICPNSLFSTWKDEIKKHLGDYEPILLWGTKKKRYRKLDEWKEADPRKLTFAMTSWDTLPYIWTDVVQPNPPHYVIGDESSFIKGRKNNRTKAAIAVADKSQYVTALTGTPYVSDVTDLWSQMRFLSETYAGSSFWRFAERYIQYDNSPWHRPKGVRPDMEEELKDLLSSISMFVSKDDVLELPEKIHQERIVPVGKEQKKLLETMMNEFYIMVEAVKKGGKSKSQERILIKNALGRVNKMQQVTAGWTKNEEGEFIRFKENPKMEALKDILQEAKTQKIVIFSRFIEDLEVAFETCFKEGRHPVLYHGQMRQKEADQNKENFMKGSADVFLAQVQKGGFGIDLTCASVCIYLTNWWSDGVRRQSEDRLHRPGQNRRPLYIDLMIEDSIDIQILGAIKENRSISNYLFGIDAAEEEETCLTA